MLWTIESQTTGRISWYGVSPAHDDSTDILECCARVLVIQAPRDGYGRATLIPDTGLPVYSGDRAIRFPWGVTTGRNRLAIWCSSSALSLLKG
jgi:hypothetical protein